MHEDRTTLQPYLTLLAELLPLRGVEVEAPAAKAATKGATRQADAVLRLDLPRRQVRLHLEVKRTHLDRGTAHALLGHVGQGAAEWLLLAPHIGAPLGAAFARAGLNYLDLHGNCHLRLATEYAIHVEGRTGARPLERPKGVRAAGVRVLFALLAQEQLLERPVREIACAAGTTPQTALDATRRLERAGAAVTQGRRRRWLTHGRRIAFGMWIADYGAILRPALHVGRYRTPDLTPQELDQGLAGTLGVAHGLWYGGTAAAFRVAPHYRGAETVLHAGGETNVHLRRLRAVPDPQGPLLILGLPGPLATQGLTPDTVHPLLIYAEMLQGADERAHEAAELLREHALAGFE